MITYYNKCINMKLCFCFVFFELENESKPSEYNRSIQQDSGDDDDDRKCTTSQPLLYFKGGEREFRSIKLHNRESDI